MRTLLYAAVAALLALVAALFVASEYGGEVVTLRTADAEGTHETHLWVVEMGGELWLRAGDGQSRWLARIRERPRVELVRRGRAHSYRAIPVPPRTAEVDALMAEKYGWADRLIGLIRDPAESVAVRLEPASG